MNSKLQKIAEWVAKPINHREKYDRPDMRDGILLVSVEEGGEKGSYPNLTLNTAVLAVNVDRSIEIAKESFSDFEVSDIAIYMPKIGHKIVVRKYGSVYISVLVKTGHPINKSLIRSIDRAAARFGLDNIKYKTSCRRNNIKPEAEDRLAPPTESRFSLPADVE